MYRSLSCHCSTLLYTIQSHSSKAADIAFRLLVNVTTDVKSELVGGDQCYSERSWSFVIVFLNSCCFRVGCSDSPCFGFDCHRTWCVKWDDLNLKWTVDWNGVFMSKKVEIFVNLFYGIIWKCFETFVSVVGVAANNLKNLKTVDNIAFSR
jgi:hypothetical protein